MTNYGKRFLGRAIVAGYDCICIILHGQNCVSDNTFKNWLISFLLFQWLSLLFFSILRYIERKIKKIYLRSFTLWNCVVFYFYIQLFFSLKRYYTILKQIRIKNNTHNMGVADSHIRYTKCSNSFLDFLIILTVYSRLCLENSLSCGQQELFHF